MQSTYMKPNFIHQEETSPSVLSLGSPARTDTDKVGSGAVRGIVNVFTAVHITCMLCYAIRHQTKTIRSKNMQQSPNNELGMRCAVFGSFNHRDPQTYRKIDNVQTE